MYVRFITLSNKKHRRIVRENKAQAIELAGAGDEYSRISFGGQTSRGRSGIAIDLFSGNVTGHKIHAIPDELLPLVRHVKKDDVRQGLRMFLAGEDVFIGDPDNGIIMKHLGDELEVYGNGIDSE